MPDSRRITLAAVGDIACASTVTEIADMVQHHLSRLGFIGFTCTSFRAAGALSVHSFDFSTMPKDFVSAFVDSRLIPHDPVAQRARSEKGPFFWSRSDYDLLQEPHIRVDRLREEAGIRGGCCAVIHERISAKGRGGLIFNASGGAFRQTSNILTAVQVIAGQVFWKIGALRAHRTVEPDLADPQSTPALTGREKAVMSWVAAGKSSWEIGKILSISEHTVNAHIERSIAKLCAANRSEAVAKAILLDLISEAQDEIVQNGIS